MKTRIHSYSLQLSQGTAARLTPVCRELEHYLEVEREYIIPEFAEAISPRVVANLEKAYDSLANSLRELGRTIGPASLDKSVNDIDKLVSQVQETFSDYCAVMIEAVIPPVRRLIPTQVREDLTEVVEDALSETTRANGAMQHRA